MAPLIQAITALGKLSGTSARVTLGKKQVIAAVAKESQQAADELARVLGRYKNPKFDLAYKASERGFTVGALQIRDGKRVIGRGAASVSGLGTEQAVGKMRMSIGENGDLFRYTGFTDLGHTPTLADLEQATSLKKGIYNISQSYGKAGRSEMTINIPKVSESVIGAEKTDKIVKTADDVLEQSNHYMKEIFAGKDPEMPSWVTKLFDKLSGKGKDNFVKKATETPIVKEFSPLEKLKSKGAISEYFESATKAMKHNLEIGNDEVAIKIARDLKELSKRASKKGIEIPKDWTKWIDDNSPLLKG